ncbi:hypothetical protein [Erythrobacter sp.]|nr:hypothetical protein [Erythrobacter sp.]QIQ87656.1 MAG: hypothetical protein G9473_13885 [Erythrobacter sp.]
MRKLIAAGLFGATLAPAGHAATEPQEGGNAVQQDKQAGSDTPDEDSVGG